MPLASKREEGASHQNLRQHGASHPARGEKKKKRKQYQTKNEQNAGKKQLIISAYKARLPVVVKGCPSHCAGTRRCVRERKKQANHQLDQYPRNARRPTRILPSNIVDAGGSIGLPRLARGLERSIDGIRQIDAFALEEKKKRMSRIDSGLVKS